MLLQFPFDPYLLIIKRTHLTLRREKGFTCMSYWFRHYIKKSIIGYLCHVTKVLNFLKILRIVFYLYFL